MLRLIKNIESVRHGTLRWFWVQWLGREIGQVSEDIALV